MDRNNIKKRMFFWYSILWLFVVIALWEGYLIFFPDTTSTRSKWIGLFAGAVAILTASCKINEILLQKNDVDYKDDSKRNLKYFSAFFKIKQKSLFIICLLLFFVFIKLLDIKFATCFICGSITCMFMSKVSSYFYSFGIIRIFDSKNSSISTMLKTSFNTSSVVPLLNIGLTISFIVILFHIFKDYQVINGFLLGYAIVSIVNCVGFIITNKAAKIANKTLYNLEHDLSPKTNPLSGLNVVLSNTFNISILNLDLSLTYIAVVICTMTVGAETFNLQGAFFPIVICANGLFASILSILITRFNKISPVKKIYIVQIISIVICCFLSFYCIKTWFPDYIELMYPIVIGYLYGFFANFLNLNMVSSNFKPARNIINAAIRGYIPVLEQSSKESFFSTFYSALSFGVFIITIFLLLGGMTAPLFGIWGVTLGIMSMISICALSTTINIFPYMLKTGYSKDNEIFFGNFPDNRQQETCNNVANRLIGMNKNFYNAGFVFCALSLIIAYSIIVPLEEIDLLNPFVTSSLLLGCSLPFVFNSFVMSAISKTSKKLVFEVKKQFRQYPEIIINSKPPDYMKCIDIGVKTPSCLTLFYLFIICLILMLIVKFLGTEALAGLVLGCILSAFCIIIIFNNSNTVIKSALAYLINEYTGKTEDDEYESVTVADNIITNYSECLVPVFSILGKFVAVVCLTLVPIFL